MIWYEYGTDDIIISTRVRLARNIRDIPFQPAPEQKNAIISRVKDALDRGSFPYEEQKMTALSPLERQALLEKHLISRQLAESDGVVLISADETVSILLGEEDHIRIQCILPNLNLEGAFQTADKVDDLIEEQVEYAFSRSFGYLTHCPTNVGTGMRASAMLHLPALSMSGQIKPLMEQVTKLGIAVRGFYGEGTEAEGSLYQFSNQVTLGMSEHEIIEKLGGVIAQVVEAERNVRRQLYEQNPLRLSDRVNRSYATLKYAKLLGSGEMKRLLSDVRLGAALGLLPGVEMKDLTRLIVEGEPGNILTEYGQDLTPEQRDEKRAALVKPALGNQV